MSERADLAEFMKHYDRVIDACHRAGINLFYEDLEKRAQKVRSLGECECMEMHPSNQ